eukprot:3934876-Rhodomonas_salina.2
MPATERYTVVGTEVAYGTARKFSTEAAYDTTSTVYLVSQRLPFSQTARYAPDRTTSRCLRSTCCAMVLAFGSSYAVSSTEAANPTTALLCLVQYRCALSSTETEYATTNSFVLSSTETVRPMQVFFRRLPTTPPVLPGAESNAKPRMPGTH